MRSNYPEVVAVLFASAELKSLERAWGVQRRRASEACLRQLTHRSAPCLSDKRAPLAGQHARRRRRLSRA